LILRTPAMAQPGRAADGLVETVDVYPTLADLCGLPAPNDLAGASLTPLLADAAHPGKDGALSFHPRGNLMGKTLRTDRYRLVQWTHRKTGKLAQVELYDHQNDPHETVNVAEANGKVVESLRKQLASGKTTLSRRVGRAKRAPP